MDLHSWSIISASFACQKNEASDSVFWIAAVSYISSYSFDVACIRCKPVIAARFQMIPKYN